MKSCCATLVLKPHQLLFFFMRLSPVILSYVIFQQYFTLLKSVCTCFATRSVQPVLTPTHSIDEACVSFILRSGWEETSFPSSPPSLDFQDASCSHGPHLRHHHMPTAWCSATAPWSLRVSTCWINEFAHVKRTFINFHTLRTCSCVNLSEWIERRRLLNFSD